MDNKVSLYLVAKKEAALIFVFMFLVATTSFIFGIKVGKEHAYRDSGITDLDREKVQCFHRKQGERRGEKPLKRWKTI